MNPKFDLPKLKGRYVIRDGSSEFGPLRGLTAVRQVESMLALSGSPPRIYDEAGLEVQLHSLRTIVKLSGEQVRDWGKGE